MTDVPSGAVPRAPKLRAIAWRDIVAALRLGIRDFARAPLYGLFFGGVFALGGVAIFLFLGVLDAPWMIIPIAIGFPLVGPFAAAGLYEVSRRLARGEPLTWKGVLVTVFRQRERQLGWMAFVVLFIFWVWVYQVRILLAIFMGFSAPSTLDRFLTVVLTTQSGLTFLAVGTLVGLVLALILFSATVVAMPLLLDTELDFVTALITSFQSVARSPLPMLGWGVTVTALTLLALAPAFLGLVVIMPVLGHATWHLYALAAGKESAA
ncbi:DUF2189 domain-containing protein [Devosia sp.]|uniref:DUF2189 domain-containing protein n=1 Tax=Devosia sp. TaxID=1871048 RepID=UPI0035AF60E0